LNHEFNIYTFLYLIIINYNEKLFEKRTDIFKFKVSIIQILCAFYQKNLLSFLFGLQILCQKFCLIFRNLGTSYLFELFI